MLQVPIQQKRMRQMSKRRLVLPAESADEGARGGTDREFNRVRVRERGETFGFFKKKEHGLTRLFSSFSLRNELELERTGKHQTKQITIGGFRLTETSRTRSQASDDEHAEEEKIKGTVGTGATVDAREVAKRKL
jgi:hypothetical protein